MGGSKRAKSLKVSSVANLCPCCVVSYIAACMCVPRVCIGVCAYVCVRACLCACVCVFGTSNMFSHIMRAC